MSLTAIAYLLVYSLGLLKALIGKPVYGLYAYLLALYMHAPARWWGNDLPDIRWSLVAAIVTLVAVLLHSRNTKIIWFEFIETKVFALFVIYVLLQSQWALNPGIHSEYVSLVIKFFILIFIIQNAIRSEQDLTGFVVVNLLGCAYLGYLGITEHAGGRLEGLGTPGMESANQLGQHIATVFIVGCYLLLCDFGNKKWLLVPVLLFVLNTVLLTESRGVLVGIAAAGVVSLFIIPRVYKKQFMLFACLGAIAGSLLIGPQIIDRFETMFSGDDFDSQDNSAASRLVIIQSQVKMFNESPIIGHGHRGTLLLSHRFIPEEYQTRTADGTMARASHNLLMSLLVDHGLIGASMYLFIIVSCFLKVWRASRAHHEADVYILASILSGLGVALVCFMVAGLGSNNKKLEIDIWLYAIIPLVFSMIKTRELSGKDESTSVEAPAKKTSSITSA